MEVWASSTMRRFTGSSLSLEGFQQLHGVQNLIHLVFQLGGGSLVPALILAIEAGQLCGLIGIVQAAVKQSSGPGPFPGRREGWRQSSSPVFLGVKGAGVPGVVCQAKESHLRGLREVSWVGQHALQIGGVGVQAVEMINGVGVSRRCPRCRLRDSSTTSPGRGQSNS